MDSGEELRENAENRIKAVQPIVDELRAIRIILGDIREKLNDTFPYKF